MSDFFPIGGISFLLSTHSISGLMGPDVYADVLAHFTARLPIPVRSHIAVNVEGIPVLPNATFFDYAVINQRRYWASTRNNNAGNSLIAVVTGTGETNVGELTEIFALQQPTLGGLHRFGCVRWLVPLDIDLSQSAWTHS